MIPALTFDSQALSDGFMYGLMLVSSAAGAGLVIRMCLKLWTNIAGR